MSLPQLLKRQIGPRDDGPAKAPIRDVLLGPEELDQCARDVALLHRVSSRPQKASPLLASFEEEYRVLHKSLRAIAAWS